MQRFKKDGDLNNHLSSLERKIKINPRQSDRKNGKKEKKKKNKEINKTEKEKQS